ncbi:MAG: hypothetical protein S4CHLAM2_17730 [Chlamydiales bacterium]|nr:hypothetical protein [Chlamydiales bacterium]
MKKMISSIPFSRLVIYLVVLGLLPLFFVGYTYTKQKNEWDFVARRIMSVRSLSEQKARKQSLNTIVRNKFSNTDPFYLDNQVASLSFLKKEREALDNLIQNPSFTGNEAAEKRHAFLSGEANQVQFTEGAVQSGEGVQERMVSLAHPVEVDTHDLKEILTRIEGNRPGKPQLLVSDFKLNKKAHPNGNEVYELSLKLLKREFKQ